MRCGRDTRRRAGVAVKSLYSQMHHSTDIISRNEDDVIALILQKDQKQFNQLLPRNSLIFKSSTVAAGVAPDPAGI